MKYILTIYNLTNDQRQCKSFTSRKKLNTFINQNNFNIYDYVYYKEIYYTNNHTIRQQETHKLTIK